jgi:hypothetical protein
MAAISNLYCPSFLHSHLTLLCLIYPCFLPPPHSFPSPNIYKEYFAVQTVGEVMKKLIHDSKSEKRQVVVVVVVSEAVMAGGDVVVMVAWWLRGGGGQLPW